MKKKIFTNILLLATSAWFLSCQKTPSVQSWQLTSPDGKIKISVKQNLPGDKVQYEALLVNGSQTIQLLKPSPLGLECENESFDALTFVSADTTRQIDEKYTLVSGKQLQNRNHAKTMSLQFTSKNGSPVTIEFRAYNDGVAFRYTFTDDKPHTVTKELTGFHLPENGKAWIQPYDTITMYTPAYEKYYENEIAIGAPSPNTHGWCFPALFQINGAWVMVSESNVDFNYFGAHLQNGSESGLYLIEQPDPAEVYEMGSVHAEMTAGSSTPWRVIIAGSVLSDIVESNLVYHVADKPVNKDFSWVKPGRASWSWWSDQPSPRDFNTLKKFIDLAAEMGWEYSLVDANWNEMKNGTLEKLVPYASTKNVGVWAWYNSGGAHNKVTEQPRDKMLDPDVRRAEMKMLQEWGVKGIKVDFFQSDKQFIMQQYLDILRDAADHQLMINFHGCTIPRGWSRTWPNLLSMESVRGAESYIFARDFPEHAPLHNVHLVFTRNVVGPMDYTPVTFSNNTYPHITSYGHELALSVVFESGAVHLADAAEVYRTLPGDVKDFLKTIPAMWDQTKLLSGSPATEAMIARQKDHTWFVGYINGEAKEKTVEVNFSFLGEGAYEALVISDGAMKDAFSIEKISVKKGDKKTIRVLPEGGFVIKVSVVE